MNRSRRVSADRHDRAIALRFDDFKGIDPCCAAADAYLTHHGLHCRLARRERQTPAVESALEADVIKTAQSRQIARESRADPFDERPDERVLVQVQRPALMLR